MIEGQVIDFGRLLSISIDNKTILTCSNSIVFENWKSKHL